MTNLWIGLGRLAADPELRFADSGTAVSRMRVAVSRPGRGSQADFFDVVAFSELAQVCAQHLRKGRQVLIEGALRQQSWNDSETGQRRSRVEIVAHRVQFLANPARAAGAADEPETEGPAASPGEPDVTAADAETAA